MNLPKDKSLTQAASEQLADLERRVADALRAGQSGSEFARLKALSSAVAGARKIHEELARKGRAA